MQVAISIGAMYHAGTEFIAPANNTRREKNERRYEKLKNWFSNHRNCPFFAANCRNFINQESQRQTVHIYFAAIFENLIEQKYRFKRQYITIVILLLWQMI